MASQLTREDTYAFAELLELLSFMDEESINRVPKKLITTFQTHALDTYEKHLSPELPLEEQNISERTISYLGILCLNYWCDTEEEKQDLINQVRQNDIKKEQELREKYSYDKMFNNQKTTETVDIKNITLENTEQNINHEHLPMDYNTLPWHKKIFSKIRTFFKNIFKTKNPT